MPRDLTVPFVPPPVDLNATIYSVDWSAHVLNATITQECPWGENGISQFFFGSVECVQNGSNIYRYIFITSYVMLTVLGLLIIVGFTLRNNVQAETWSYSPQDPNEAWYWRILRGIGPG
jgi:hypothetical protein